MQSVRKRKRIVKDDSEIWGMSNWKIIELPLTEMRELEVRSA